MKILITLLLSISGLPAVLALQSILTRAPCFHLTSDEAAHAEAIETLAQTGLYENWTGVSFVAHLTTGPTLIAPAAFIEALTSIPGGITGRMISLLYFSLSIFLMIRFFSKRVGIALGLFGIGLFFEIWQSLSDNLYYPYAILGEGPGFFFLLSTLLAFERRNLFLAGITASLATLSKPYFLFLPLCVFLSLILTHSSRRDFLRGIAGLALPWFLWIGWMILQMGFASTLQWWMTYPQIMRNVNGAGISKHFDIFEKLSGLWEILHWRGLATLVVGFGILAFRFVKSPPPRRWLEPTSVFALVHFLWWIVISPGVQARYLFPSYSIFSIVTVLAVVTWIHRRLPLQISQTRKPVFIAGLFLLIHLFIDTGVEIRRQWKAPENCGINIQLAAQKYLKSRSESIDIPLLVSFSSQAYGQDAEWTLAGPYSRELRPPLKEQIPRNEEAWVMLTEHTHAGIAETIIRECQSLWVYPKTHFGFWACSSKKESKQVSPKMQQS